MSAYLGAGEEIGAVVRDPVLVLVDRPAGRDRRPASTSQVKQSPPGTVVAAVFTRAPWSGEPLLPARGPSGRHPRARRLP